MTLILTEIHCNSGHPSDPYDDCILFAADRRYTFGDNRSFILRPKACPIDGLCAAVAWFGYSSIGGQYMDDWMKSFITDAKANGVDTIGKFAERLTLAINDAFTAHVPSGDHSDPTGFHIAGYEDGEPVFWFVRNVEDDRSTWLGEFRCRQDFPNSDGNASFRNGDIRLHEPVEKKLIEAILPFVTSDPDKHFSTIYTPHEHAQWLRFLMDTLIRFYDIFCNQSIIGGPTDIILITPVGGVEFNPPA